MKEKSNLIDSGLNLPLLLLESGGYRWLRSDAWEDDQSRYFFEHRASMFLSIFRSLPARQKSGGLKKGSVSSIPKARPIGKWVFECPPRVQSGWAEAQEIAGLFRVLILMISPGSCSQETYGARPLSLLVSGLFIAAKPDLIYVVPSFQGDEDGLKGLGWGSSGKIHSIKEGFLTSLLQTSAFQTHNIIKIMQSEWWTLEQAKEDQRTLAYLVTHMKPKPARKKRFIEKFFLHKKRASLD